MKAAIPQPPVEGDEPEMEYEETEEVEEVEQTDEVDDGEGETEEAVEQPIPAKKVTAKPKQTLTMDELLDMVEGHQARANELIRYIRSVI